MTSLTCGLLLLILYLCSAAGQLDQVGYCRLSDSVTKILPGNFSRAIDRPYDTTITDSKTTSPVAAVAGCLILSFDTSFDALLGDDWSLRQIGPEMPASENYAHEAPVYLSGTNEVFFLPENATTMVEAVAQRINLDTGEVTPVPIVQPLAALNGATRYGSDSLLAVAVLGDPETGFPAGVGYLDPYTGVSSWRVNSWFGLRFPAVNDLVALRDGSIIFTVYNTSASEVQQTSLGVWIAPLGAAPRCLVANLPQWPNGIALSPDHRTLYVGIFADDPKNPLSASAGNKIYAYDLVTINGGLFAQNGRIFAALDVGSPDGFKFDSAGNLFTSAGDGVQVFSPGGKLIGKIVLPNTSLDGSKQPVNSLAFAGALRNELVMLHHTDVMVLTMNTTGVPDFDITNIAEEL